MKPCGTIGRMEMPESLTLDEAAKFLQMHPVTVRRHLRAGKLPGRKIGGEWRISRTALEQFLTGDQKPAPEKGA